MDITKINSSQLIFLSLLTLLIHHLSHEKNTIEGLTNNNKIKLRKCIEKVINRHCTHPLKALRLKIECEYGENDEYLGIECGNNNLIDRIICSDLINKGACDCQFGRNIIANSCNRKGVDKKCNMRLRSDSVLINSIRNYGERIKKIQKNLDSKEKVYNEKIATLEKQLINLKKDKKSSDKGNIIQSKKVKKVTEKVKLLIRKIKLQTKKLKLCDKKLSEEKKAELDKLKDKLNIGLSTLRKKADEEQRRGLSKERLIGIIQKQKEVQEQNLRKLKDTSAEEQLKQLDIFNKLIEIRDKANKGEESDLSQIIKENKTEVGIITLIIFILIIVIIFLLTKKDEN